MNYCFLCGEPLELKEIENLDRLVCSACGWVHYEQLKVSAAALVVMEESLLLVKRSQEPWKGCWYLPAGYAEADEDPADAAVRELFEETGLIAQPHDLAGAYYFQDDPRGNGVLLVYNCDVIDGSLVANDEVEEAGLFTPSTLPEKLTGAGHERAINDWVIRQKVWHSKWHQAPKH
ncbi:NUDIX domain-containing protein [bacterium]|nr:NUDIX domain-containing protein [bacterium]